LLPLTTKSRGPLIIGCQRLLAQDIRGYLLFLLPLPPLPLVFFTFIRQTSSSLHIKLFSSYMFPISAISSGLYKHNK